MKTRESGMPDEGTWEGFFQPEQALGRLGLSAQMVDAVDFGCGYGTFAIPAARVVGGTVYALDIDPAMVAATIARARGEGLANVQARQCDFVTQGTGLPDASVDYAMLFNILHAEQPELLLHEAWRVLGPGGVLAIMHWDYDPSTPRGPSMAIRPHPEHCRQWAQRVGFQLRPPGPVDLPPHHYGWVLQRPAEAAERGP